MEITVVELLVPEAPSTLAQASLLVLRLFLGIANVGFWVMASIGGLAWVVAGRGAFDGFRAVAMGGIAVAIQAVFDGIGGGLLVPAHPHARGGARGRAPRGHGGAGRGA